MTYDGPMKPDLADPAHRKAYKKELRGVAVGWRFAGLALVGAGGAPLVYAQLRGVPEGVLQMAWMALGAGWVLVVAGIVVRTRYHRARMAEE
jgi:hypothetical protein